MTNIVVGLLFASLICSLWVIHSKEMRPAMSKLVLAIVFLIAALGVSVSS